MSIFDKAKKFFGVGKEEEPKEVQKIRKDKAELVKKRRSIGVSVDKLRRDEIFAEYARFSQDMKFHPIARLVFAGNAGTHKGEYDSEIDKYADELAKVKGVHKASDFVMQMDKRAGELLLKAVQRWANDAQVAYEQWKNLSGKLNVRVDSYFRSRAEIEKRLKVGGDDLRISWGASFASFGEPQDEVRKLINILKDKSLQVATRFELTECPKKAEVLKRYRNALELWKMGMSMENIDPQSEEGWMETQIQEEIIKLENQLRRKAKGK